MYAIFDLDQHTFLHFAGALNGEVPGRYVLLGPAQLQRLRAIYRSGFGAAGGLSSARELLILPTKERRPVHVPLWVRAEEGGGLGHVPNLHTYSQEMAGELAGDELEKASGGRVQLSAGQAEVRAQAAVADLLVKHPDPSRASLLESFQGLWTVAHVDMRASLAEGLRVGLGALKERGVLKQVEKAQLAATVQRAAEIAG